VTRRAWLLWSCVAAIGLSVVVVGVVGGRGDREHPDMRARAGVHVDPAPAPAPGPAPGPAPAAATAQNAGSGAAGARDAARTARQQLAGRRRAAKVLDAVARRQRKPSRLTDDVAEYAPKPALNSPKSDAVPGTMRPCAEARDFAVYTLGSVFKGQYAARYDAYCNPAPDVIDGRVAVPTRANSTEVAYGPCLPAGPGVGCSPEIVVENAPVCERPYALYFAMSGPPGEPPVAPPLSTLRGVPAAIFEDRVELWTWSTFIAVTAPTQALALAAVSQLQLQGRGDIRRDNLPSPPPEAVQRDLAPVPC
jgi:hypothetical protein